jgi:hypothetical protein
MEKKKKVVPKKKKVVPKKKKVVPKKKKVVPKKKKVVPKKEKHGITIISDSKESEIDENKYSRQIQQLIFKIKNQHLDIDNGIRFGWK